MGCCILLGLFFFARPQRTRITAECYGELSLIAGHGPSSPRRLCLVETSSAVEQGGGCCWRSVLPPARPIGLLIRIRLSCSPLWMSSNRPLSLLGSLTEKQKSAGEKLESPPWLSWLFAGYLHCFLISRPMTTVQLSQLWIAMVALSVECDPGFWSHVQSRQRKNVIAAVGEYHTGHSARRGHRTSSDF